MSKIRGAIPPLPQHASMAWCSVKAQTLRVLMSFVHTVDIFVTGRRTNFKRHEQPK
jgi:hypothetical protein